MTDLELVTWIEHFEAECSGGGQRPRRPGHQEHRRRGPVRRRRRRTGRGGRAAPDRPREPMPTTSSPRSAPGWPTARWSRDSATSWAPRSTSRPGSPRSPGRARVLVDDGAHEALGEDYAFRRLRRTSVKGYERLQPWALRRRRPALSESHAGTGYPVPDYVEQGGFDRDTDYIPDRITRDSATWPVEPGRYRLVAAKACPWATRAIIVRQLLGPGGRDLARALRPDARRAQLDLRPRPGRGRPGARHQAARAGLPRALPGLRQGHHGAGGRRRRLRATW